MSLTILVVDDEDSLRKLLKHSLENRSYKVIEAHNGATAIEKAFSSNPDLIILDYALPDISGLDVLKSLRQRTNIPVIFLTVQNRDQDKVEALDAGADDYLTKPFSMDELMARIRVALRHNPEPVGASVFSSGGLELDRQHRKVKANGIEVKLSATEYTLLLMLVDAAGKVVPHKQILHSIWGPCAVDHGHYLRVYFWQIRKKLNQASTGVGDLIENESGIGYKLHLNENIYVKP